MKIKSLVKISILFSILMISIYLSLSNNYKSETNFKEAFPDLTKSLNKIKSIKFEYDNNQYNLLRKPEGWVLEDYNYYPVDNKKINNFIWQLVRLEFIDKKDTKPNNFNKLGLNYPLNKELKSKRIKFYDNDKVIYDFIIGKSLKSNLNKNINYFRNFDQEQVWLFNNNLNIPLKQISWIKSDLFEIGRWRIREVTINHKKTINSFKIYRDSYSSQNYKFDKLPKDFDFINNYSQNSLAASFEGIKIENMLPLSQFNSKEVIFNSEIKVHTFDGLVLTLKVIKIDQEEYVQVNFKSNKLIRKELPIDGVKVVGIPKMLSFKEVEEKVKELKFVEKWLYKLDVNTMTEFKKQRKDIIKKIKLSN